MFPGDNNFESEFTFETRAVPVPDEPPFHVLILGDWSANSGRSDAADRSVIEVDRDNFDEVLNRFNVTLKLDLYRDGNSELPIHFKEIDDFHPDSLFRNVGLFSDLRDVRRRLSNSDTFESAAREVRSWSSNADQYLVDNSEVASQIEDTPPIDSDNLLDMILTQPSGSNSTVKPKIVDNSELGRFVSKIVSPHLIQIDENEQSKLISVVDETISELMRTILHHPKFQALEAAWRSLYFLVRRIETGSDLKIYILDLTLDELNANLKSVKDLADSLLYRKLNSNNFSLVAGNYSFGVNVDDVATLIRLGQIAKVSNAPFISYIKPELFGVSDFSKPLESSAFEISESSKEFKLWMALRSCPEANYIGLSPMKVFLRMPYGSRTDSIESFSFEELNETFEREHLMWMNPSFAITLLLAKSYSQFGWEMRSRLIRSIDNLPLFMFNSNGEAQTVPCNEILLTESIFEKMVSYGLMPLISNRDTNYIRLITFQSVSSPSTDLAGPWN